MNYTGIVYSFYDDLDDIYLDNLNKKGIVPVYKNIRDGNLIDYKDRDSRKKRVKPLNEVEKLAKSFVKKPEKVTPGYKKKMALKRNEIENKLYAKQNKKGRRK